MTDVRQMDISLNASFNTKEPLFLGALPYTLAYFLFIQPWGPILMWMVHLIAHEGQALGFVSHSLSKVISKSPRFAIILLS